MFSGVKEHIGSQSPDLHGEDDDMAKIKASYRKEVGRAEIAAKSWDNSMMSGGDQETYHGEEPVATKDHESHNEGGDFNEEPISQEDANNLFKEFSKSWDTYMVCVQDGNLEKISQLDTCLEQC